MSSEGSVCVCVYDVSELSKIALVVGDAKDSVAKEQVHVQKTIQNLLGHHLSSAQ